MAKTPTTGELKHRITLCSAHDVVTPNGELQLLRDDVFSTWAKIDPRASSQFNRNGDNILDTKSPQTHVLIIRARKDIDISNTAWVYEKRALSGDRWYKVRGITDVDPEGQFLQISATLMERGIVSDSQKEAPAPIVPLRDHGVR